MTKYSLEEVFSAAGRPTAGIQITWDSSQVKNQKGAWQNFDQFIWSLGFSKIILTLGKGECIPSDGDEVFIYCQRVISSDGEFVNYSIHSTPPSEELTLEDFTSGKTPDVWKKSSSSLEEED